MIWCLCVVFCLVFVMFWVCFLWVVYDRVLNFVCSVGLVLRVVVSLGGMLIVCLVVFMWIMVLIFWLILSFRLVCMVLLNLIMFLLFICVMCR